MCENDKNIFFFRKFFEESIFFHEKTKRKEAFLSKYYKPFNNFVKSVAPTINPTEYEQLSNFITQYVPGFNKIDMVDALSTLIHQVGFLHCSDHEVIWKIFVQDYGISALRHPFISFERDFEEAEDYYCDIKKSKISNNFGCRVSLKEIQNHPEKYLVDKSDILRTRVFYNCYGTYRGARDK